MVTRGLDCSALDQHDPVDRCPAGVDHYLHGDHTAHIAGAPTLVAHPLPSEPHDEKWSIGVVVTVRSDGTLLLNGEPLNLTALRARLEQFYKSGATRVIFVRGENAIEFGRVAEVVDMARGAGLSYVALIAN